MNLYVNAVNALIAHEEDRATVGFILCADRNEAVAHLTLQGIATPIAVTRYTVGEHGVLVAGEDTQITEGLQRRWRDCGALSNRSPSSPPAAHASSRRTTRTRDSRSGGPGRPSVDRDRWLGRRSRRA
jgi:hypothetical protein